VRAAAILLLINIPLLAQFRTTVPLVVAPTTVTDSKGKLVDGLSASDLILYDNNVPQTIQVDDIVTNPISLVVVVEANNVSQAVIDKLHNSGILFTDLLSAETGETALLAFAGDFRLVEDFTSDSRRLSRALHGLHPVGGGCSLIDTVGEALRMLKGREEHRRRIVLVISESRDRSSKTKLPELLKESQLQNTSIYWLTYSTFLTPYTTRPKRVWDRMSDEQKEDPKRMRSSKVPNKEEDSVLPPDPQPGGSIFSIFTELAHKTTPDAASMLTQATGGRTYSFLKQKALEEAIQAVAAEVHRQYIITYQPKQDAAPGQFHTLRAAVKDRPDLSVRTRAGYWRPQ
jgi:VWFA-related protein